MNPYTRLIDALESIKPDGWELIGYETPVGPVSPDATTIEVKLRNMVPMQPVLGSMQVEWVVSITTKYTDREVAEPSLFEDLITFVMAIGLVEDDDGAWFRWTRAEKALNEDGRLAYDITLETTFEPETTEDVSVTVADDQPDEPA